MAAQPFRDRLIPYKILAYLEHHQCDWLEYVEPGIMRVYTPEASRILRVRNKQLWDALKWLAEYKLIKSVRKERKRGTAIIRLTLPENLR